MNWKNLTQKNKHRQPLGGFNVLSVTWLEGKFGVSVTFTSEKVGGWGGAKTLSGRPHLATSPSVLLQFAGLMCEITIAHENSWMIQLAPDWVVIVSLQREKKPVDLDPGRHLPPARSALFRRRQRSCRRRCRWPCTSDQNRADQPLPPRPRRS